MPHRSILGAENRRAVRVLLITGALLRGREITARWIVKNTGVTLSAARKDMRLVTMYLPVKDKRRIHAPRECREKRISLEVPGG